MSLTTYAAAPVSRGRRIAVWLLEYVERLYLMRFPVLLVVFLVGFAPFALFGLPAMFRSMLILSANGIAAVTLSTTAAALTVLATRRVVTLHGPARFGLEWPDSKRDASFRRNLFAVLAMTAPIVISAVWLSATEGRIGWSPAIGGALLGLGGGWILVGAVTLLHAGLVDANEDLPGIVLPAGKGLVKAAHRRKTPIPTPGIVARLMAWLQRSVGPGYFSPSGAILPGHLFSAGLIIIFGGLYVVGYFAVQPGTPLGARIPALVYLLIVVTMATWVLSAAAFWLDRYRLPTLLTLAAWSLLVWTISKSDHYFDLEPLPEPQPFDAPERIAQDRKHPILAVVAVDGGGIQAAAWAARVLTGIVEEIPAFQQSVRFISSVSGGSLGTMYFVGALDPTIGPSPAKYARVRELSMRGSLNEAAWGVAYPDLMRIVLPSFVTLEADRGWALERAWTREWMAEVPTLSEWRNGIREGWRPAISFNASGVETGERFSFGTFTPPDRDEGHDWRLGTPLKLYKRDISVATAARLSATFPYVSPIARARASNGEEPPANHFADGGYYDNTGMGIAMRWLDEAMRHRLADYDGADVAFIRIRSAPNGSDTEIRDRGWLYEAIGPIQTLVAVRTAGQWERAETELDFLHRMWCDRGEKGVDIRRFEFAFELANPPLSWQLSPNDVERIDREWASGTNTRVLGELKTLLTERKVSDHCVAVR
jgi:hypothetical protein